MKENIEKTINVLLKELNENFDINCNSKWTAEICEGVLSLTQAYQILHDISRRDKEEE